jgi:hypothetical protein
MHKVTYVGLLFFAVIVLLGFTAYSPNSSFTPPRGYTGATGAYCTNCHGGNVLNAAGGSVSTIGLPLGNYVASGVYDFSLTIQHSVANRSRWGFSIIALNSAGSPVGTFSSTNPNAAVNGNELSHFSAPTSASQSSYTFSNLRWTAPASTAGNNQTITFYFVGNAANGLGSSGDFIYAGSTTITAAGPVPVVFSAFDAETKNNQSTLSWTVDHTDQLRSFVVEQAADGRTFQQVQSINAQSASSGGVQSYSFLIPETLRQSPFWRIKAIEWDGSTTFSKIIRLSELSNNNEAMFKVLQNPVRLGEAVKIQWLRNDLVQPAYTWFDVSGRRLSSGRLRAPIGSNQLIVPPPTTPGLHKIMIQAQTNSGEFVRSSQWVFMQ